ncbi:hypothetical protein HDU93_002404, partial [Gonapodya sp. JEL0774]
MSSPQQLSVNGTPTSAIVTSASSPRGTRLLEHSVETFPLHTSFSASSTPTENGLASPVHPPNRGETPKPAVLVLQDETAFQGYSFGAEDRSVAGECVFQSGMVGYPESLTDPSYAGQILILTFPLVGYYGVPSRIVVDEYLNNLPRYFESHKIHVAALVVAQYSGSYSHYLATSSLSEWLKEQGIPALYGVDTRLLVKKIRTQGVMLGKILVTRSASAKMSTTTNGAATQPWLANYVDVAWHDPNTRNLVAEVSCKAPVIYKPRPGTEVKAPNGKTLRVMAVDMGMKYNQIRCFVNRGVELKVVPWDYDFIQDSEFDALFLSNGPGDPTSVPATISRVRRQLELSTKPVFGICLGHQILALASSAKTSKMEFGNRGQNIPCTDLYTGRCYITSQNHCYAVDTATLADGWAEWFVNANDGSNEGIMHKTLPYFSVQFHPEANRVLRTASTCSMNSSG